MECFWKAYEQGHDRAALKCYLLAFRSIRTPNEYESRLTELHVSGEIRAEIKETLDQFAKKPEKQVDSHQVDELLEKFTQEYHRSTGS